MVHIYVVMMKQRWYTVHMTEGSIEEWMVHMVQGNGEANNGKSGKC